MRSVADQTLADFECIVVDDGSSQPIESVVAEFDERFSYVRRKANGGPTAARLTGFERATGDLVARLDSDNELFHWTFDRAAHYLRTYPEADAANGLYVFPDGFHARVAAGVKVVGADEFAALSSPEALGDAVSIVRRRVVEEWLRLRRDYYVTELVFSLSLRVIHSHSVVLVDEPWGRFHTTAANKVSTGSLDPRWLEDIEKFVNDFRPLLGSSPCGPVDVALIDMWARLVRARRYREAASVADWMRQRGIPLRTAIRRKLLWASRRRITSLVPCLRPHIL